VKLERLQECFYS